MRQNNLKISRGAINHVKEFLNQNKITGKILYVSDPVIDKIYGEDVKKQISEVGTVKEEIVDYNTIEYSMNVAERVIATDIDCLVALGGGKVLDVAKYAAYVTMKPLLSIPTAAGNDGIASNVAVLKRKDDIPKSLTAASPTMLLVDLDIIEKSPIQLIKAGIGDTISNYTALMDWDFAVERGKDQMNGYAYMISRISLDGLMKTQYDSICPEFIEVLVNSLVISGIAMDFAGSSRPVSGSEHLFSHALDFYAPKKNLHGIQVALGTVAVLKVLNKPYDDVLSYLKKFEVDINPRDLGIDKDTFILCMQKATSMRKGRYTQLHEADLNSEKLSRIYDELVLEL